MFTLVPGDFSKGRLSEHADIISKNSFFLLGGEYA